MMVMNFYLNHIYQGMSVFILLITGLYNPSRIWTFIGSCTLISTLLCVFILILLHVFSYTLIRTSVILSFNCLFMFFIDSLLDPLITSYFLLLQSMLEILPAPLFLVFYVLYFLLDSALHSILDSVLYPLLYSILGHILYHLLHYLHSS